MSFKEYIQPMLSWYYDDCTLKERIINCIWSIMLLPIAPAILAVTYQYSAKYEDISCKVFRVYVIAMWLITITGISLLVFL